MSVLPVQRVLLVCFLAVSVSARALAGLATGGGSGSHGGGFVACRDSHDRLVSLELADVYEGRVKYGLTYRHLDRFPRRAFRDVLPGTPWKSGGPRAFRDRFNQLRAWVLENRIDAETGFEEAPDVVEEVRRSLNLPRNCEFFQAAAFTDSPDDLKLFYEKLLDYANELNESEPDRGSYRITTLLGQLVVHEIVYRIARERAKDVYSVRARYLVALYLADERSGSLASRIREVATDLWAGRPFRR